MTYQPDPEVTEELGMPPDSRRAEVLFARGEGCSACGGRGFRGRTGVFEVLRMSDSIRRLVMEGRSAVEVEEAAVGEGMMLMQECGMRKVIEGITSPEEVMRVVYVEED
jgi:type II secretory ATPase GspE/PulE/Tfp pilus assembly ATPase PilB-like protein